MKSTITFIASIVITIMTYSSNPGQEWSLRKSYTTQVDLVVNYLEGGTVKQRTAKAGLKYRYIETVNNNIYIQFISIKPEEDPFKSDDNYVNSMNDEIVYLL